MKLVFKEKKDFCLFLFFVFLITSCSSHPVRLKEGLKFKLSPDFQKIPCSALIQYRLYEMPRVLCLEDKCHYHTGEIDGQNVIASALLALNDKLFKNKGENFTIIVDNIKEYRYKYFKGGIIYTNYVFKAKLVIKNKKGEILLKTPVEGAASSLEFDQKVKKEKIIKIAIKRFIENTIKTILSVDWDFYCSPSRVIKSQVF